MNGRLALAALGTFLATAMCATGCEDIRGKATIRGVLLLPDGGPASGVAVSAVPCMWSDEVYDTSREGIEYLWDLRKLARGVPDAVSGEDGRFSFEYSPGRDVGLAFKIPGGKSRFDTGAGVPLMMPSGMSPYPPIRLQAKQTLDLGELRVVDHSMVGHIVVPAEGLGANAEFQERTRRIVARDEQ